MFKSRTISLWKGIYLGGKDGMFKKFSLKNHLTIEAKTCMKAFFDNENSSLFQRRPPQSCWGNMIEEY